MYVCIYTKHVSCMCMYMYMYIYIDTRMYENREASDN